MPRNSLGKNSKLVLRMTPEQKKKIAVSAGQRNITMNQYCTEKIMNTQVVERLDQIALLRQRQMEVMVEILKHIRFIAKKCSDLGIEPHTDQLLVLVKEMKRYADI